MPLLCFQVAIRTMLNWWFITSVCAFAQSYTGLLNFSISDFWRLGFTVLLYFASACGGQIFAMCATHLFEMVPKSMVVGYCKPNHRFKASSAKTNWHFWEFHLHSEYLK